MRPLPGVIAVDALRAGCCALVSQLGSVEQTSTEGPCQNVVTFVGYMPQGGGRRVVAFACASHGGLLTDPASLGADLRHGAELARRRSRDAWLRAGRRG